MTTVDDPVQVRHEEPADEPAVQSLVAEAFGGPRVPALLASMRTDSCWLALSFVAEMPARREVVGHVSYTRGWVDDPDRLVEVLVLSPLSVHPKWQRRGVGTQLVEHSMAALRSQRPEPLVFLEGDPRYYRRVGFVPAGPLGFVSPSTRIPAAAFQARPLRGERRPRGALVYPDVFWRHDCVGLR